MRPFEGMLVASNEHHFSPSNTTEDSVEDDFTGSTVQVKEEVKEDRKDSGLTYK